MKDLRKYLFTLSTVILLVSLYLFFTFTAKGEKKEAIQLPVITVINPIRGPQLGLEKTDLFASLKGQWKVIKDAQIPATWLWQYSALENQKIADNRC